MLRLRYRGASPLGARLRFRIESAARSGEPNGSRSVEIDGPCAAYRCCLWHGAMDAPLPQARRKSPWPRCLSGDAVGSGKTRLTSRAGGPGACRRSSLRRWCGRPCTLFFCRSVHPRFPACTDRDGQNFCTRSSYRHQRHASLSSSSGVEPLVQSGHGRLTNSSTSNIRLSKCVWRRQRQGFGFRRRARRISMSRRARSSNAQVSNI